MFGKKDRKGKQNRNYQRVYELHERAGFLFYVDDAYMEPYEGNSFIKLEGVVAFGKGFVSDSYVLCDCKGKEKAIVTIQDFYVGNQPVNCLEGGDKRVAIYPKEQDVSYCAGDYLYQKKEDEQEVSYATDYE